MDPNGDDDFSDQDGLFEFATCHAHFHFQHYATYQLIDATGRVWKAAKRGFCMDTDPYNVGTGDGTWNYRNCGSVTVTASRASAMGGPTPTSGSSPDSISCSMAVTTNPWFRPASIRSGSR